MRNRFCLVLGILVAATVVHSAPARADDALRGGWRFSPPVTVLGTADDPRQPLVREAVDYWNQTFAALGTPFRLGSVSRIEGPIPSDAVAEISREILGRHYRSPFPDFVRRAPNGIVVVLATVDFISFAALRFRFGHALVAIKDGRAWPLTLPNVARNVIAHELGHAIGLGHDADPGALMCGRPAPCRPDLFASPAARYFPLTDGERAALLQMYPRDWTPH